ncbi:MAG: DeoR/GlpR transcriptional regulator [Oscillibacter sp.]|nr:DeoR/GlpR transcriptional regulator [Oscillibacter sp.]
MKQDRQTVDARRAKILSVVRERQRITVEELSYRFGVSLMTIRRDLRALEDAGKLGRFHGGARAESPTVSESEKDRVSFYRRLISRYAATLIRPGERVFINGSATALDALEYVEASPVYVFTNNGLAVGRRFPAGVDVTLSGGSLRNAGHIMTGDCAMRNLLTMRADKALIGCSGISPNGEILCDIPTELGLNETMIGHAERYFILVDHTKVGKADTYASFSLETAGCIITDEHAPAEVLERLRMLDMEIIQVGRKDFPDLPSE